ncbi:sulfite exporter TauE/SafE family protein [Paenibacillus soyae]|uniref:Probable membrane transporter protein n=1 Tax=Paenibacillus soyae TaxID=2969249 RepID=A0A9X2MNK3_9BACL|nr:TSUP family transporter [Paenibacillus soyae]MCR2803357.1 TSUP family transporter [Paenibacillus soyae]
MDSMSIEWTTEMILIIIAGGFLAAFVDSVVGGGGLISVPALLAAGLPPHLALGTNKLAGTMSSLTSTIAFFRSGNIDLKMSGKLVPLAAIGAVSGTLLLQLVPSDWLRPLVVAMLLLVTVYTLFRKDWGKVNTLKAMSGRGWIAMAAAALLLGGYDGFFGPGTGSFLIFAFLLLGLDFVKAAGNAKLLNFTSNLFALGSFFFLGSISYGVGLLMGAAMVLGSLVGSRVAIKQGARYVRPLFIGVSALLIARQVWTIAAG